MFTTIEKDLIHVTLVSADDSKDKKRNWLIDQQ